jgi:hypothetical protein
VPLVSLPPGTEPLPFFAEYPYYLWGEVNYDSEGDCKRPTDRQWTWLDLEDRGTGERLAIRRAANGTFDFDGDSAAAAAALTAARTGALFAGAPADHEVRCARADRVRAQFLDPDLAAFDSHGWWGGWKWVGDFSTDLTSGLRVVLQSIHERRRVDPQVLEWVRSWHAEPPRPFHREGVAFAVEYLARLAPR